MLASFSNHRVYGYNNSYVPPFLVYAEQTVNGIGNAVYGGRGVGKESTCAAVA
jgi:hypothetical protein